MKRALDWLISVLVLLVVVLGCLQATGRLDIARTIHPSKIELLEGYCYIALLKNLFPSWWGLLLYPSDSSTAPKRSSLKLFESGASLGPPNALHADIMTLGNGRFSDWNGELRFSSTDNTDPRTNGRDYRVTERPNLARLIFLPLFLAIVISIYRLWLTKHDERVRLISFLLRVPLLALRILGYAAMAVSFLFVGCALVAFFSNWALPSTALVSWSSWARIVASHDFILSYFLLTCAGLGVIAAWIAPFLAVDAKAFYGHEVALGRLFNRWGFLLITCLLVSNTSTMWLGIVRPDDFESASIGGLIAFSDAGGYVAGAYDLAKDGLWQPFDLRRPLAAAFREILLFMGGSSVSSMLLLQACALAAAMCFATSAIARWRGLWAGIAFFAFTYLYTRTFSPTALTEPLGIIWTLVSIPFWIAALNARSLRCGLLALAFTVLALLTRMGSMFTIPALMAWIVYRFGVTLKERIKVGLLVVIVVVAIASSGNLLKWMYGAGDIYSSNFAYTLCGLTIGTTWDGCVSRYADELGRVPPTERDVTNRLYTLAWENFQNDPTIFLKRIIVNTTAFAVDISSLVYKGYFLTTPEPVWFPRLFVTSISLIGVLLLLLTRREHKELSFWIVIWASILLSAGFVYGDDGRRVLAASYILVFTFLALGFANPAAVAVTDINSASNAFGGKFAPMGIATIFLSFFFVPWLAHRTYPLTTIASRDLQSEPNQALVFGGHRMTGFLVVADGAPKRSDVPTLQLSDFRTIIRMSNIEVYQGLVDPETPKVPFAFVFAPRLEKDALSSLQFITPPEVIERREVEGWRLQLKEWQRKPPYGPYWFYVTHAEPIQ